MSTFEALLLCDLQNEIVHPDGKIGAHGIAAAVQSRNALENAATALAAAREAQCTVTHVRLGFQPSFVDCLSVAPRIAKLKASGAAVLGEWGTEFAEQVQPRAGELVVTKACVNPFFNTGLLVWLLARGVKRLAIGGVATNLVVEAAARAADDAGFEVTVLEDCCASPNAQWHLFATENILPLFGRVVSSQTWKSELRSA